MIFEDVGDIIVFNFIKLLADKYLNIFHFFALEI